VLVPSTNKGEKMITNATEKLKAEMKLHDKEESIQKIGNFLLQQLSENPEVAEKLLDPNKSIVKSLENMQNEVKKSIEKLKKTGVVTAVLTDEEGLKLVLKYYGIKEKAESKNSNAFDMLKDLLK
jgi:pantoate kinase